MKCIMYHYVRKYNEKLPLLNFLHIGDFEKQIDFFARDFEFFDCNKLSILKNEKNLNKKVLLTFDDSLSCHYDYVFKLLKKKAINGIFFIPSAPYTKKKLLNVHKIHLILAKYGGRKAYGALKKYQEKFMVDLKKIKKSDKYAYKNQINDEHTSKFKRILNHCLKYEFQDFLINKVFNHFFENQEANIFKSFYIKRKNIEKMLDSGMVLGSHTENHYYLSNIPHEIVKTEIESGKEFLKQFTDKKIFAYPYGGPGSYNNKIVNYVKRNYDFSFVFNPKDITKKNLVDECLLNRYDCNSFKFGNCFKIK